MSQFDTTKNKLKKLWNDAVSNKSDIGNKSNEDSFLFFDNLLKQQNIKTPLEIYNSGDIFVTPELIFNVTTATKGTKLATSVSYSELIDLEIPEIFLPFVKYSVEAKTTPETNAHALYQFSRSTWEGDYVQIKGDAKLIFVHDIDGISPSLIGSYNGSYIFPDSYFSENNINLDLTKKVWRGNFTETEGAGGGNIFGNVTRIHAEISPLIEFNVNTVLNPGHKIISLTSTSFTAIGDFNDHGSITEDIQKTYIFSSLDDYWFMLNETAPVIPKDDIETQEFEENGRWLFWSNLLQKLFVLEIVDEKDGDKQIIEIKNLPDTGDGDIIPYTNITLKRNLELSTDLPDIVEEEGVSVSIGERNLKNYVRISESEAEIPKYRFKLNGEFIISSLAIDPIIVTREKDDIITQEFKLIDTDTWNAIINKDESSHLSGIVQSIYHRKERVSGSIITEFFTDPINNSNHQISALSETSFTAIGDETVTIIPFEGDPIVTKRNNITATKIFADAVTYTIEILDTIDFPVYDDIYSGGGTLITEDHTILPKELWLPETPDVTITLKAYLINPLYWREHRKYNKNDI